MVNTKDQVGLMNISPIDLLQSSVELLVFSDVWSGVPMLDKKKWYLRNE
jgi:hypothetical protein